MKPTRSFAVLALTFVVAFGVGCNHLFYFPDSRTHLTPDKVELPFTEHRVEVEPGITLNVWHIPPKPKNKVRRKGVIVHFHGNGENMSTHFLFSCWLALAGFDVVTFDYRGYGKSTGEPSREGLVKDGLALLNWVANEPTMKDLPIVVLGQSLGGAVGVPVVALAPAGQVKILAVESTFSSYRDIARGKLASFWLSWPFQYPLSYLVSDDFSAVDYIGRWHGPFLVMHGKGDRIVPIAYGQALFDASPSKDKEIWALDDDRHTPTFADDDSDEKPRFVDYLCKRLGCPPAP